MIRRARCLPFPMFGVPVLLALLLAPPASAQLVRAFTPRFSTNATGDVTLVGNTIMTCTGGGNCTNGRNGSGGNLSNNDFTMVYVDVDADATTFSSSTADLALPVGATLLWAGLYWGGESANAARNTVRFGAPAAGYGTVTAGQLDASGSDYSAIADVTTQVRAGGNGTYSVANVYSTPNQSNKHGGWSLVVVYNLNSLPLRNLVVFDGYAHVNTGTNVTINVNGFVTPPAGVVNSRLGVVAFEGDLGYTGDQFLLNNTAVGDARNPTNNFFNSSISLLGATFTAKNPNYLNQLGFDADIVSTSGILPNSANSAVIQMTSNGDEYYPAAVTFATDLYAPVFSTAGFTKTVTDLNGPPVRPGDVLEYTVTMTNSGQDHAGACVMRDTLASNLAYVPGSLSVVSGPNAGAKTDAAADDQMEYVAASRSVVARLGTGANGASGGQMNIGVVSGVRFRATVSPPAPTGTVVSNQGWLSFNAVQSGQAYVAKSDGDPATPAEQPTVVTTTGVALSGTVFEDGNYGGGAGRSLAASGGTPRPGARVELYTSGGAYLWAVTTDASGRYDLGGWPPGNYLVRVVAATVTSARAVGVAGLVPVPTFRTDVSSGSVVAVANYVGGETPRLADAASNTTSAALASLTTAATTAQSVTPVTLALADLSGVDFGFNFDTIVNVNDAGYGSLRQFILNANATSNAGLAQAGLTPGLETSIFMVSDGLAHPGLRAGLTNLLTSGIARVNVTAALPAITGASTSIDGATQAANVGNTNAGTLGVGGTVGVDALALSTVAAPEVEIVDAGALALGLDVQAASTALSNIAVLGFGNAAGSNSNADVRVGAVATATLDRCVLGAAANAFVDPGIAARSGGDHLRVAGGSNGSVTNCLIGFGNGSGIALTAGSNNWQVTSCEIRGNAIGNPARAGIAIESSGAATMTQCLITSQAGPGVDAQSSTGSNALTNCTVSANGTGTGAGLVTAGVRLGGVAGSVARCVIRDNYGAGVMVAPTATRQVVTRSQFQNNGAVAGSGAPTGQIGIDVLGAADNAATGTSPFVTLNDNGDPDVGGNDLLNFPVLESAAIASGSLTLTGWARPGSTIELFVSDGDPSGFGEGMTYATTVTEGSAGDLDGTTSAYSGPINGINQGSDNTNRFRFVMSAPSGISAGTRITATATLAASGTSEFSGVVRVGGGVSVSGYAYADANHNTVREVAEAGTAATLYAKLVVTGGASAQQVAAADPVTGVFTLASVAAGSYQVVLATNNNPADVAPGYPSGWIGTEASTGVRSGVAVAASDLFNQNFGLWRGSRVDGAVFKDDGAPSGTANDGQRQAGETGVAGARMALGSAACAGAVCDSTVTDGAGAFTLWLPFAAAGANATVSERGLAGWVSTGGSAGTTGGSYARASDVTTFVAAAGLAYSGVVFGDVPPNSFAPPAARSVTAGGAAFYLHTFTAGSAGSVSFAAARAPSPAIPGWTMALYRDLNCNGGVDPGEPPLGAPVVLGAGQSMCVVARHDAPAGAPSGAGERATLTASFSYTGAIPALGTTHALDDLTTVVVNGLAITKSVDRAAARPGDTLTYTILYTNQGALPVSAIVINDATPVYTQFVSASCGTLGAGLGSCGLNTQPAVGAAGPVRWTFAGSLSPGASGSVSFVVKVQ